MAQSKVKKKVSPAAKKPAAKPAPIKKAAAKKAVAVKKSKPAAKVSTKAKPKPKPVAKAKPKPTAPAKKQKSTADKVATAKAEPTDVKSRPAPKAGPASAKRAVAVSHRPQTAPATVQVRPVPAKSSVSTQVAPKPRQAARGEAIQTGPILNEDQIRRAPDSAYMNDAQLAFFQERLLQMRNEVLTRELDVKERLHQREVFADPADRASAEEEHWLDLRLRERESLLLKKIDDALRRIRDKEYGYCEKTGEAIGIARLLARPTATVCVDIKGQDERAESQYRDR